MTPDSYSPIGYMKTCFTEKFGVPRQSLMVSEARAILKLNPDPSYRVALNHLEKFTHVWVIFVFHQHLKKSWRPTIRPPRLDGPRRVGVFASRSPHRPNPIGMSALKLDRIDLDAPDGIELHFSGSDIMDGTPVLDIKPYLPFTDRIADAGSGWADSEIIKYPVSFSDESLQSIRSVSHDPTLDLRKLIEQLLEWDPRPTSQRRAMPIQDPKNTGMKFAFRILDFDIHWEIQNQAIHINELRSLKSSKS
jgi:tRNA-Thr(GGU) m(6)t(6)A37 methyltransferase TsaA